MFESFDQAVAALEAHNQGGIKKIIQSIDPAFADLLADGEAVATPASQANGQESERREPTSSEVEPQLAQFKGANRDSNTESLPSLQRSIGRRTR